MLRPADPPQGSQSRRLAAGLGIAAGILLVASLFLPYWQARLYAPQYRQGLRATMYAHKLAGDIDEIDNLNHYVGVAKLGSLAVLERKLALPSILLLAALCVLVPRLKRPSWRRLGLLGVAGFPAGFVADMAYWMNHAATTLDPTAPLKLKPFSIPVIGAGKVGQFRSDVGPMPGFYVALGAVVLLAAAVWLLRERKGGVRRPAMAVAAALCVLSPAGVRAADDLQALIAAAPEGSVLVLPEGLYRGPVTIERSMTIRGEGRVAPSEEPGRRSGGAVIDGGGLGTVVTVRAPRVVLENLVIRGSGEDLLREDSGVRLEAPGAVVRDCLIEDALFGIYLAKAPDAVVEGNVVRGKPIDVAKRGDPLRLWYSDRATVRRNRMEAGRDAVLWFSNGSVVEDNEVRGGRYGLHFMYTDDCRIARNVFVGNSVGAYIMYSKRVLLDGNRFEGNRGPSGAGLGLKESDSVTVVNNAFRGNRQGLFIDQSPILAENVNRFARNLFAGNDVGIAILPGAKGDVFTKNILQDNHQQVSVRGGGALDGTAWHENGRGNYWSDYAGYGAAGETAGRLPYRVEGAFESLMDKHPLTRFFLFTPAAQALELAGRAFPLFRPKARLTDPHPLLRPPFEAPEDLPPLQASAFAGPVGLLALSGGLASLFRRNRRTAPGPRPERTFAGSAGPAVVLKAENVRKSFGGRVILRDFDFELRAGESVVLWGRNGAGKSTFLKCALGLLPFEGRIDLNGHDARRQGHLARRGVGYLAQEFAGYDWTVREAMEFVCDLRGLDRAKIAPALAACGLAGEERKPVPALSGGMRQKLALAQALAADPAVLLLDEPCSNLDQDSRRDFLEVLAGLRGTRSLLLTSHRAEEAEKLADRVLWLEEGAAPRSLTPAEFSAVVGGDVPLWVRLEDDAARAPAMDLLRRRGYEVSPNGHGFWVKTEPRRKMDVVRALEAGAFAVRDIRQEDRP